MCKANCAQAPKKINVEHSNFDVNQVAIPDAILTGNVRVNHDGVVLTCNKTSISKRKIILKLSVMYN
jgi:hypothetical protein